MLFLLSYVRQHIGNRNCNLVLNTTDAFFLLGSQVKTGVQGISTAPVDFNQLILIEDLVLGGETRADGEVFLGIS
mgnify:CR=1 FL=1